MGFAGAEDEHDGVGRDERFAVAALDGADLAGSGEQEADVGDHERVEVGERVERRSRRAGLVELVMRLAAGRVVRAGSAASPAG